MLGNEHNLMRRFVCRIERLKLIVRKPQFLYLLGLLLILPSTNASAFYCFKSPDKHLNVEPEKFRSPDVFGNRNISNRYRIFSMSFSVFGTPDSYGRRYFLHSNRLFFANKGRFTMLEGKLPEFSELEYAPEIGPPDENDPFYSEIDPFASSLMLRRSETETVYATELGSPSENGAILIGTNKRLYQWLGKKLESIDVEGQKNTKRIYHISDADEKGRRLVVALNGQFLLKSNQLLLIKNRQIGFETGRNNRTFLHEKVIYLSDFEGVYRLIDDELELVAPASTAVSIEKTNNKSELKIVTLDSAFYLRKGKISKIFSSNSLGQFLSILAIDTHRYLLGTKTGIYLVNDGAVTPYVDNSIFDEVRDVNLGKKWITVISSNGVYVIRNAGKWNISKAIRVLSYDKWVAYYVSREGGKPLKAGSQEHSTAAKIAKYFIEWDRWLRNQKIVPINDAGDVLHSVGKNLSLIRNGQFQTFGESFDYGEIHDIIEMTKFEDIVIKAEKGIFSLVSTEVKVMAQSANVTFSSKTKKPLLQWHLSYPCTVRAKLSDLSLKGKGTSDASLIILDTDQSNEIIVQAKDIDFSESSDHSITLEFKDPDTGKIQSTSIEVNVPSLTLFDLFKKYSWLIAGGVFFIHSAIFLGLIWGARRSKRCWQIINDPIWGRFGMWFYFALRHSSRLQRWCLERWFTERRRRIDRDAQYVQVPIMKNTKDPSNVPALLANLKEQPSHCWLQGNAGMGKTTLVNEIERMLFADPDIETLNDVYQNFGFVPLVIPLRNYKAIIPDSKKPEQWLPSIICAALTSEGMQFNDVSLLKSTIHNNRFLLVLDGANEIGHGAELELYAQSSGNTHLFVTSQSLPHHAPDIFQVLHLPLTISDFIEQLLVLYLGKDKGEDVFRHLTKNMLEAEIQSGYDVRVLVDLVEATTTLDELPQNRLALYKAMVTTLTLADGSPYPVNDLCKVAWTLHRCGTRAFSATNEELLSPDLLASLLKQECRIVRVLNGDMVEFRHDQMRAYLAAYWVAKCEVSPISLLERETDIWRLARTDQVLLWSFFADLVDKELGTTLWKWAQEEDERHILQHELYLRGKRERWSWVVW